MYANGLILSLLFSCSADKSTDSGDVSDTAQGCGVEISGSTPFPEAIDMYYLSEVSVTLSAEDETAVLSLVDASGTAVEGSASNEGISLVFQPLSPLAPLTDYIARVQYCGNEEPVEIPFRTSELGAPLAGGNSDLLHKTFAVDLRSGLILEPPQRDRIL